MLCTQPWLKLCFMELLSGETIGSFKCINVAFNLSMLEGSLMSMRVGSFVGIKKKVHRRQYCASTSWRVELI